MLANNRVSAVLVSTDLERSQRFYEDKVGLTLSPETIKNHLLFDCGDGTTLLIYGRGRRQQGRPHPGALLVDRHRQGRRRARRATASSSRSTTSETFKTVDHVVTTPGIGRSAWFKDPDGNTIAVFQPE